MPLVRVSNGGTELKYTSYQGAATLTVTCKEAYLYAASTSNLPVVTKNGVTQTPLREWSISSYAHDRLYYFENLNNASIKIDKGRGAIFYY